MNVNLHANKVDMLIYIYIKNLILPMYLIFQDVEYLSCFSELADSLVFTNINAENAILHKYI